MSANKHPTKKPAHEVILGLFDEAVQDLERDPRSGTSASFAHTLSEVLCRMIIPEKHQAEVISRLEEFQRRCETVEEGLRGFVIMTNVGAHVRETLRRLQEETTVAEEPPPAA